MYIKRNDQGQIIALSRQAEPGYELASEESEELLAFLQSLKPERQKSLAESDLDMVRVLEDLVAVLIERSVIRFTDLPAAAQTKLMYRRELRKPTQKVDLLDSDDDLTL
jgi:hypothetical protein